MTIDRLGHALAEWLLPVNVWTAALFGRPSSAPSSVSSEWRLTLAIVVRERARSWLERLMTLLERARARPNSGHSRAVALFAAAGAAASTFTACGAGTRESRVPTPAVRASLESVGLDPLAMDRSADPCRDFYRFACGGWLENVEIPADRASVGRATLAVKDRTDTALRTMLEGAPEDARLAAFYRACVDERAREAAGTRAIDPFLAKVRAIADKDSLAAAVADIHRAQIPVLFRLDDMTQEDDSAAVLGLFQDGLSLEPYDYTSDNAVAKAKRESYAAHVARVFELAGVGVEARQAADDVLRIERALASSAKDRAAQRDLRNLRRRIDLASLQAAAPHFGWAGYLAGIGRPDIVTFNVDSQRYLDALERVLRMEPMPALRHYVAWTVLGATLELLPKRFGDESFSFTQTTTGQTAQRPRSSVCVDATVRAMPDTVGRAFVAHRFSEESKRTLLTMADAIRGVFAAELAHIDWMDARTRDRAMAKLERLGFRIGYPDEWRDESFNVSSDDYAANVLAAQRFEFARRMMNLGKPDTGWRNSPAAVDAYADKTNLLMVFTAGILQPPFFDPRASVAVNYGAIGYMMGHELTHHFDDQGAEIDERGQFASWWSPAVRPRFDAMAACVVKQFSLFDALPGVHVDGKLTVGDNLADIGGLKLAVRAYHSVRARLPAPTAPREAEGFTDDQQLFLAFAQASCMKEREEALRRRLQTNVHAPAQFRVAGAVADTPEFSEAFHCARPATACDVW